jgi:hypothetical protein
MTERYWFKPKQYGYGATPVTWEGWALTLLIAGLIAAASAYVFAGGAPSAMTILIWAVVVAAIIAGSVLVVRSKTEGSWRWRWGDPE